MEKNKKYQNTLEKILLFLEKYEKSKEFTPIFEEKRNQYASLFEHLNIYLKILDKTKIVEIENGKDKRISFFDLTDKDTFKTSLFFSANNCPKVYAETDASYKKRGIFGLEEYYLVNGLREYSLIIDEKGKLCILMLFNNGEAKVFDFKEQKNAMFLNLPLIISGIMRKDSSNAAKIMLEKIVEKNPLSTVANIYKYIKNDGKKLDNIPSKITKIDSLVKGINDEFSKFTNNKETVNFELKNSFIYKNKEVEVPYTIEKNNEELYLKLDVASFLFENFRYKQFIEYYPALIKFEKNGIVPYYFKEETYQQVILDHYSIDDKTIFNKNNMISLDSLAYNLITKKDKESEQYHEQYQLEQEREILDAMSRNGYSFCDYDTFSNVLSKKKTNLKIKKELKLEKKEFNKTLLSITKKLENFIDKEGGVKLLNQEKTIDKIERKIEKTKKLIDEIAYIMWNIYKNEILITNI